MDGEILKKIFDYIKNEDYCVVKFDEESLGKIGGDIDIYCMDISKLGKKILYIGNSLLKENLYDNIKLTENKNLKHAYIDFYIGDKLQYRFDLFGKLPDFKTIEIKKKLFSRCLESRFIKTIQKQKIEYDVYVPEETYDLLLRFIEYIEYYPERQAKIKHLSYVSKKLSTEQKRLSFLTMLTDYVLKRKPKETRIYFGIRKLTHLLKRVARKIKKIIEAYR